MKPLIIYAQIQDGKITIDRMVFEQAIKDAYEHGKADAQPFNAIRTTEQPKYLPDYYGVTTSTLKADGVAKPCTVRVNLRQST